MKDNISKWRNVCITPEKLKTILGGDTATYPNKVSIGGWTSATDTY